MARDATREKGRGAVEKESKVENALFLCRWCTCARNRVSSRYLTSKFVLSNGNKTSE